MARTKFTFEKRQKELAKKQKKEEKAARRAEAKRLKTEAGAGGAGEEPDAGGMDEGIRSAGEMNGNPSPEDPDAR